MTRRLLFADDDPAMRILAELTFEPAGWAVDAVPDGDVALERLAVGTYDLVVLDEHMPPTSGLATAATARARGDRTPIVLWSGWLPVMDAEEIEGLDLIAIDKVDLVVLAEVVAEHLDHAPTPAAAQPAG